jgi:hypothetical protein
LSHEDSTERFWNGTRWTDLERRVPLLSEFLVPVEPLILALLDNHDARLPEATVRVSDQG